MSANRVMPVLRLNAHGTSMVDHYDEPRNHQQGSEGVMTMTRNEVIERLERHEPPYQGWHLDWPDLYAEYFNRLTTQQQALVRELNAMNSQDFAFYRRATESVNRIP